MDGTASTHPVVILTTSPEEYTDDFSPDRMSILVQTTPRLIFDARHNAIDLGILAELAHLAQCARAWWGEVFTGIGMLHLPRTCEDKIRRFDRDGLLIPITELSPRTPSA